CEALRVYRAMDLPAVALRLGGHLARRLDRLREHPLVGDIRTLGFLAGIELMADGERRVAFPPEWKVGAMVERRTREHGLIVRNLGDVIAICPPYIVSEAEIDQLVEALGRALDDVAGELRGAALQRGDGRLVAVGEIQRFRA